MKLPAVLPMRPYLREVVWGGRRLGECYHKDLPADKPIGESLEVSALPGMESEVANGPLAGWSLARVMGAFGAELVGEPVWERYGGDFPLLIKLLDPREDLSIQVHPDDQYAQEQGLGKWGKMEAWYVLHSEEGRIAHGLRAGVGRRELEAAIAGGRVEEAVEFFPVHPGQVVFSPPGTVHALCRGVVVYEVQQSSDLTFRLYDYKRPGLDGRPRQLHIAQGLEVIDFGRSAPPPASWREFADGLLVESEHFTLRRHGPCRAGVSHPASPAFAALTLIEGGARVRGEGVECTLRAGETALVSAGQQVEVLPAPECEYLIAAPRGEP
ncbi:MAG: class I mannose-6-phosphate isomerase [Candidatus Latescibacteria bacterium]|nr:class I mannose-6-phosphate isomerase [Candidatus Latescibacterota bacterium]